MRGTRRSSGSAPALDIERAARRARCNAEFSAPPLSLENANDQRNGFFTTKSDVAEHQGAVNGFVPL